MSDIELDEVDKFYEQKYSLKDNKYADSGDVEFSDEEVMGVDGADDSSESSDDSHDEEPLEEPEDEDDEGWGNKENYYGGDDVDEVENKEDAQALVQESVRIQKKHMNELHMDDYFDEEMMADWKDKAENTADGAHKQVQALQKMLESGSKFENLDKKAQEDYLNAAFPEFLPLCKEFGDLYSAEYEELLNKTRSKVENVQFVALSSYLCCIVNYVNLLMGVLKSADDEVSLKSHPIMETILSARETWKQAQGLEDTTNKSENSSDEVQGSLSEEIENNEMDTGDDDSESESGQETVLVKPKVARELKLNKYKVQSRNGEYNDKIEGAVDEIDAEDKRKRKKSLRFYTSKIDQQSAKKDARFTGDEDLPYKERLYERQQRLMEEARKRGLKKDSATMLDNEDFDATDEAISNEVNGESLLNETEYEKYYNSVKFAKESKRSKRKEAHSAAVKAAKEGKLAEIASENALDEDGKRAINYQILKNKGLTAKRKKETQNSRVKKRKKYEQAQKKLRSIKQVYKAPEGPYGGEKTGIKKNLSKSIKFK